MALLSTAPSFETSRHVRSVQAKPSQFPQLVRAAASASTDAKTAAVADGLKSGAEITEMQWRIFSTDEVKVPASEKMKLISVSVPRFHMQPVPRRQQGALSKPPGLHIRPPPGLTNQPKVAVSQSNSKELRALLGLSPLQSPTPALVPVAEVASEEDGGSASEDGEVIAPAALPLPMLLGSRPQSSLPGSMPCFAKPLEHKRNDRGQISACTQRHVSEMPVKPMPS